MYKYKENQISLSTVMALKLVLLLPLYKHINKLSKLLTFISKDYHSIKLVQKKFMFA